MNIFIVYSFFLSYMKNIKSIITEEINKFVNEVKYIDNAYGKDTMPPLHGEKHPYKIVGKTNWTDRYEQEPIKNSDKIRVFHKCSMDTAMQFALYGASGKVYAKRAFSYESGMNPKGIFVTTDFNVAKNGSFASHGVIIEFTASATNLDTPVWNGQGTYFGQGTQPMPFANKSERDAQKKKYNDDARSIEDERYFNYQTKKDDVVSYDYIRNSDNPAMAYNIFNNNEHQALFLGDLNPNMIKRFWVKEENSEQYVPYKRVDFIRKFKEKEKEDYKPEYSYVFNPNDDFSWNKLAKYEYNFDSYYCKKSNISFEEYLNKNFKEMKDTILYYAENNPYELRYYFWPKQLIQILGKEKYLETFGGIMGV